ncbi:MAG TPA: nitroreductase family protein [Stellaceae bacterium]|nr:nitroreductase family protein [Stellaceae bacterium]
MPRIVNDAALDTLFRAARSHYVWLARPVSDTMLRALWELIKRAPTSGIPRPAHLLFIRSDEAKARLTEALPEAARPGLATAPVAAVVGRPLDREHAAAAMREGGLQTACLILAARALGLDCGPFWDFDNRIVDADFFPDGAVASTALCAIGYGDPPRSAPQPPRPGFDETCTIL